ncbi:3-ketoacyl-ACP reductase [Mycolicibacterium arabiense]|uniref:3-ketoacyl-ACP reductase n=1 Tax=Mycolicibacterium arabiense TaxID=1286181 RepID=A0A7I7RX12_9MYCO|nr:SDR family oxidoreductase [Mycolicibacterium arabiense]MCV7373808.1 SDR family oxidoreductase [Mycolicibacterium arabiense]BBY49053.1 3-ketoacyl-ACP reductase [Mycolicibacterium arabiense]
MSNAHEARVAVVTGGSGGIGREIVERLATDGFSVAVHYSGSADRAEQVVRSVTDANGSAFAVQADVADEDAVSAMFDEVTSRYGGVDVIVNTAGIMMLAPLAETSLETFDRTMRTNVRGTFVVSQWAAKNLRDGGALINFSSSVVKLALPTYSTYAASKGAVDALTLILAKELRGRNVTVNTVAPGPTATPLFLDGKSDEQVKQMAGMAPLERLGEPADVAEVVAFLAGPARWMNGQTIYVNGGVI